MQTGLKTFYRSVQADLNLLYVVPLIQYQTKNTDYLYLFHKEVIRDDEFEVKTVSVFGHWRFVASRLFNKKAILHYHWLEFQTLKALAGMPWKLLCIILFKLLGGKIIWTIHNEQPHDGKFLTLHLYLHRCMARVADRLHVHCETAQQLMAGKLDVDIKKIHVIPHPAYPVKKRTKPESITVLQNNYDITLQGGFNTLLMFGRISSYKGILEVCEIVANHQLPVNLVIAGRVKYGNIDYHRKIKLYSENNRHIHLFADFIPEKDISAFFGASDIAVFNYKNVLTSGSVQLARDYGLNIVAPNKGCLSELEKEDSVQLFSTSEELKNLLITLPKKTQHEH